MIDRPERPRGADVPEAAALYERYGEGVFRYVLHRVARQEEAEDITAEVFAAALVGLHRFRGQCPPRLWLLSIARRKVVDSRRRRAARRETLLLQFVEQLPVAEIAQVMGRSPGSVKGLLERAKAAIYRRGRDYFEP